MMLGLNLGLTIPTGAVLVTLAPNTVSVTFDEGTQDFTISWHPPGRSAGLVRVQVVRTDAAGTATVYDDTVPPAGNTVTDTTFDADAGAGHTTARTGVAATWDVIYTFAGDDVSAGSKVPPAKPAAPTISLQVVDGFRATVALPAGANRIRFDTYDATQATLLDSRQSASTVDPAVANVTGLPDPDTDYLVLATALTTVATGSRAGFASATATAHTAAS